MIDITFKRVYIYTGPDFCHFRYAKQTLQSMTQYLAWTMKISGIDIRYFHMLNQYGPVKTHHHPLSGD